MQNWSRTILIIVIAGIATLSLVLLAVALSDIKVEPLTQLPFWLNMNVKMEEYNLPGGDLLLTIVRYIYIGALIMLPIGIIYLIISKVARKQFVKMLLRTLPFAVVLIILLSVLTKMAGQKNVEEKPGFEGAPAAESSNMQTGSQIYIEPSEQLVTTISIIFSTLVLLLLFWVAFWMWRRSQQQSSMVKISEQAQTALDSLQAGGNLRNTIIRCYNEMSQVIADSRGLQRTQSMTPHEFIAFLIGNGFPSEPVHQLTDLFEQVRYGAGDVTPLMERIAIDSLESIVFACRRPVEKG
jgi:hypothetical protein